MMLLNNDHGHPLPDAPVFYSVLSKNKQELRAAARANRMMKRFHLTIPYIIACLMAYYGFFRYYPQLKTSFLGICILYYAAAYFIRWYLEPQYACSFCGIGPTTSQNRIRFSFLPYMG